MIPFKISFCCKVKTSYKESSSSAIFPSSSRPECRLSFPASCPYLKQFWIYFSSDSEAAFHQPYQALAQRSKFSKIVYIGYIELMKSDQIKVKVPRRSYICTFFMCLVAVSFYHLDIDHLNIPLCVGRVKFLNILKNLYK